MVGGGGGRPRASVFLFFRRRAPRARRCGDTPRRVAAGCMDATAAGGRGRGWRPGGHPRRAAACG
ncbi:hypothetical protein BU14_0094s0027 [Porphyra umbilicalis]|uniref:Uncharacterized protein n=1 Tax=Porphyra umbilicalis TaxID=2786 RepID=A0A1X6PDU6_PORUM|nr:hypothetical protein BU14_0094s0027 [Porphyra umbilicalis]|eukprot:OSX78950.1 hypothetical protein BU14_0094s0027 [Porphyra umbilicalis]